MSTEYRLPPYATVIERSAPRGDVHRVVIHKNVTEIADDAFRGWASLEEVIFESNSRLERIGDCAFAGTALREFAVPERLREMGEDVFRNSELKTIRLPSTLQNIREKTFAGCMCLRRVEVAEGCKLDVRGFLPTGAEVVPVQPKRQTAQEASASDSPLIEVGDAEEDRESADAVQ